MHTYVFMYVSVTLRNVAVTSGWNVAVSCLLRNSEQTPHMGAGYRRAGEDEDVRRTVLVRAGCLEENETGPTGGGGGERGIFNHGGPWTVTSTLGLQGWGIWR